MRIHTNTLSYEDIRAAFNDEKRARRIYHGTVIEIMGHGSRSHARAFEIKLSGSGDPGQKLGNSGQYGASDDYAATFDEWGWLLSALFAKDAELIPLHNLDVMTVGTGAYAIYDGRGEFNRKTGNTYRSDLAESIAEHGDLYPWIESRTNRLGRRGFARSDMGSGYRWPQSHQEAARAWFNDGATTMRSGLSIKYAPRTAEWARAFYAGEVR